MKNYIAEEYQPIPWSLYNKVLWNRKRGNISLWFCKQKFVRIFILKWKTEGWTSDCTLPFAWFMFQGIYFKTIISASKVRTQKSPIRKPGRCHNNPYHFSVENLSMLKTLIVRSAEIKRLTFLYQNENNKRLYIISGKCKTAMKIFTDATVRSIYDSHYL